MLEPSQKSNVLITSGALPDGHVSGTRQVKIMVQKKKTAKKRGPQQIQKSKQARQQQVAGRRKQHTLGGGMSECAKKYAMVLNDPFSGAVACVPTEFNFPSMKHSVRSYGSFTTSSTTGVGFVSVCPFQMMWYTSGSGGGNPVTYSISTYTGNGFAQNGTGVIAGFSDSPYAYNVAYSGFQGRLVACGLRIRNTTAALYRGGVAAGLEEPNHLDLGGQSYGLGTVMQQDTAESVTASSDQWLSVVHHPQTPAEVDFINYGQITAGTAPYGSDYLGFITQAPGTNAQTYEFEVTCVFEAIGGLVHGESPSESDPQGFAKVQNATASPEARKPHVGDRESTYAEWLGYGAGYAKQAYNAYQAVTQPMSVPHTRIEAPTRNFLIEL